MIDVCELYDSWSWEVYMMNYEEYMILWSCYVGWLILLFNKIRFENKIIIEVWGCLINLESLVV
jgi:hypothetical protein